MDAVQAMTGHGGWPLNAFLTPEGVPFYAGTYYPPEPRQGMPSWRQVLVGVAEAWRDQREEIEEAGRTILPRLRGAAQLEAQEGELDPAGLVAAVAELRRGYDWDHGGFSRRAPKFPSASVIEFLFARGCAETLDWALRELRQEEGGFASALDADSEGVEGRFYVWTPAQVREVLGADADRALASFGMTEAGNFEGANI